jgi:ATP-dependent helicase Lhr and Lhr-like helicase
VKSVAFSAATGAWFADAFPDGATPVQTLGWPVISSGAHALLCAPTGSGKTLAAFLDGIDRIITTPRQTDGVRLLYVSPLKALNYDVERNLRGPLAGIRAAAARLSLPEPLVTVAVRTGDTPAAARQRMLRHPPDVLITTPESLFLLLTSPTAGRVLAGVEAVIIDEVHAVAATKRGTHLALSLERLDALAGRDVQRIALSATQRPLEEVARFVGGDREVAIVDAGQTKQLDLAVLVPVEDMTALPDGADQTAQWGDPSGNQTIWPAVYPALLDLVRQHRTTLVFVNYRRLAERLALRLNELAGEEIARAHHGSLAREARSAVEEALKRGELRCLVATSSLELGIDMGAIDLVIQVESPGSVARGLQRIGRAGHQVDAPSTGRIFPKYRGDLLECAVVARRMHDGAIEQTRVPQNPLDVLAQQIVAVCATGEVTVAALETLVRRAYPYHTLPREQLEGVLDMLSGRYPSDEFAELRPRIIWDRVAGTLRGRDNVRALAVTNAGTIPDRGLYGVFLVDGGGRVGELDEEMVYEARVGQVFLLGASGWRIERITRDRVLVSPAPGQTGQVPFWRGDAPSRPVELGRAIGEFTRRFGALGQAAAERRLVADHDLNQRAATNLVAYLREQRDATGALPTDRVIVVERFRDEIGDWRICVLSPFGGRVHAPWALALGALVRERYGVHTQALWSDDGIVVHVPDADEPPDGAIVAIDPDVVEELVVRELASSALYAARFRENAARALLIPRRRPGQRTPLWQQRLRAQSLIAATERYGSFPIVLETYRECLSDVFDVPALTTLLGAIERREVSVVEAETPYASPFASSLLFDYVAHYMYEGDTPPGERRAQALSLDRRLLRELLGSDELRDLLDPAAIASVEAALRRRRAPGPDGLHDLLRRVGDLTGDEVGDDADAARLVAERRAVRMRIGGETRLVACEDAGRYRDGVGALPPTGLPAAFLEPVADALRGLVARYAATHGPFAAHEPATRLGVPTQRVVDELRRLEALAGVVRGAMLPGGSGEEWCDAEVLRRVRRATLASLRSEVEAVAAETLARFALRWQGADEPQPGGVERLREVVAQLQGVVVPVATLERDVLARRVAGYRPEMLDALCAAGEVVWCGAGEDRAALYLRSDAAMLGPVSVTAAEGELVDAVRAVVAGGEGFFADIVRGTGERPQALAEALWRLVWSGEITNDAFAPLRAGRASRRAVRVPSPRPGRSSRRLGGRPQAASPALAGRWSSTRKLFTGASEADRARARAEALLERHGVLTRSAVRSEGVPGGFPALYPELSALETVGAARRGYFVEGLGGAQFALPGAVERLRDLRDSDEQAVVVLAACDPAQLYGSVLAWPERSRGRASRSGGAFVVLAEGRVVLFVERGGRSLVSLVDADEPLLDRAVTALAAANTGRIAVERVDGAPVSGSVWEARLLKAGFRQAPRRLIRD